MIPLVNVLEFFYRAYANTMGGLLEKRIASKYRRRRTAQDKNTTGVSLWIFILEQRGPGMELLVNSTHLEVIIGSLAFQHVDALVHPTNNYLWFSTGVSEDLKRRGGEFLEKKAMEMGPIEPGTAVIAPAGRLKSKYLIHAAAWGQDMMTNEKLVHRAIASALILAKENQCETLSIPVSYISVNDFMLPRAMETVFLSVVEHSMQATSLKKIVLLVNNQAEKDVLNRLLQTAKNADPPRDETDV